MHPVESLAQEHNNHIYQLVYYSFFNTECQAGKAVNTNLLNLNEGIEPRPSSAFGL